MLEPDDLRFLLNLDEERFSNENLQMLIDLYTDKIVAKIKMLDPDSDALNSPLFDEALLSGIACHLSMMDPTIFLAPTKYEVGDTVNIEIKPKPKAKNGTMLMTQTKEEFLLGAIGTLVP